MRSAPLGLKRLVRSLLPAPILLELSSTRVRRRIRRRFGPKKGRSGPVREVLDLVRPRRRILFYPQRPWPDHVSFKLCALLRYRVISDPERPFDVAIKHLRGTYSDSPAFRELPVPRSQVVNGRSIDVSKHRVEEAVEAVFGYALAVDPATHEGPMVEKSDENAQHDGRVVDGPLRAADIDSEKVYERLVCNESEREGCIVDHRVPVHGDRIPLVYRKHRPLETRFRNENAHVDVAAPDDVFTAREQKLLVRLVRQLDLDVGELDVLRDTDGRLYVVDVANTPAGPPGGLPNAAGRVAMQLMAASYERFLDDWIERRGGAASASTETHRERR